MSKDYELEQVGEEITNLNDMSKLTEAFLLAESGKIAYVEELSGKKFVVITLQKFDKLFEKLKEAVDNEDELDKILEAANKGSEDE